MNRIREIKKKKYKALFLDGYNMDLRIIKISVILEQN